MIPKVVSHLDLPDYEFPVKTNVTLVGWSKTVPRTVNYLPAKIDLWTNCYCLLPQPVFPGVLCIVSKKEGGRLTPVSNPSMR